MLKLKQDCPEPTVCPEKRLALLKFTSMTEPDIQSKKENCKLTEFCMAKWSQISLDRFELRTRQIL